MRKLVNFLFSLSLFFLAIQDVYGGSSSSGTKEVADSVQIRNLSLKKWEWIQNRDMDSLNSLFHQDLLCLKPGIRMDKLGYLDLIKNGNTRYSAIRILDVELQVEKGTYLLLSTVSFKTLAADKWEVKRIKEVYQKQAHNWQLQQLEVQPLSYLSLNQN